MDITMTTRRAAITLAAAVAVLLLLASLLAGPAAAAPRSGITVARGLPAERAGAVPTGGTFLTHEPSSASIAAPVTQRTNYFVIPPGAALAIGVIGAVVLVVGACGYAVAQRRRSNAPPVEMEGRRPEEEERRKAA